MGLVGCYSLVLYCDEPHGWVGDPGHHADFTGRTYGECAREARRAGWLINPRRHNASSPSGGNSGFALCPRHSGKCPAAPSQEDISGDIARGKP